MPALYYTFTVPVPDSTETVQFVMIDTESLTGGRNAEPWPLPYAEFIPAAKNPVERFFSGFQSESDGAAAGPQAGPGGDAGVGAITQAEAQATSPAAGMTFSDGTDGSGTGAVSEGGQPAPSPAPAPAPAPAHTPGPAPTPAAAASRQRRAASRRLQSKEASAQAPPQQQLVQGAGALFGSGGGGVKGEFVSDSATNSGQDVEESSGGATNAQFPPRVDEAQWAWVRSTLASSTATWVFVVGHHPVWSTGDQGPTWELASRLNPMLVDAGVAVYVCGHEHMMEHLRPVPESNNVDYVVIGSGAYLQARIEQKTRSAISIVSHCRAVSSSRRPEAKRPSPRRTTIRATSRTSTLCRGTRSSSTTPRREALQR